MPPYKSAEQKLDTPRSLYQRNADGIVKGKPEMIALVNKFGEGCLREKVKLVRERSGSPEHFREAYDRIFTNMEETSKVKSFKKSITPITSPAAKSKGVDCLTDGIFASYESWQSPDPNWVYYTGNHMDFILDLGEVMPINFSKYGFFKSPGTTRLAFNGIAKICHLCDIVRWSKIQ